MPYLTPGVAVSLNLYYVNSLAFVSRILKEEVIDGEMKKAQTDISNVLTSLCRPGFAFFPGYRLKKINHSTKKFNGGF